MAEYEGNGDFNYSGDGSSDFKRRDNATTSVKSDDEAEENTQLPEKVNEYVRELLNEKVNMDNKYPHADKLLDGGSYRFFAWTNLIEICLHRSIWAVYCN